MEDRIAALEQKVLDHERAINNTGMRGVALRQALTVVCAPLMAKAGLSADHVRLVGARLSIAPLYKAIDGAEPADSDAWTTVLSDELASIMGEIAEHVAGQSARVEEDATKLARTLRAEMASAAIAECESFRNLCEHNADSETDPAAKAALFQISLYARTRAVALRSSLPSE